MKRLPVSLSNKSPFSVATSRAVGNVQESLDFIPGTLIRGALAKTWLEENEKKPDDDFKEIFTGDKISFGNIYIKGATPIPLSAYSCKYYRGFNGDKDKHGVKDILLSLIREEQGTLRCPYLLDGKECKAPMKKLKGYYLKNIYKNYLESINVRKRLINHTAISPITETALENALFSQEVVESEQLFKGEIWIHDDTFLKKLTDFIEKQDAVYIGADRSTGLGKFEIALLEADNTFETKNEMMSRISKFNNVLNLKDGKIYFSITLQSDAVITDKYLRYKTFIDKSDLGIPESELICGIAESRLLQGWNSLAKLPKEDVIAIEKGSVFVFSVNTLNDDTLSKLYDLEMNGIGKRGGEGFGRITICDPFHIDEGLK